MTEYPRGQGPKRATQGNLFTKRQSQVKADPLESWHQEQVFYQAHLHLRQYPLLAFLFAVPNGGFRFDSTAAAMKRQGVKAGVPDLCLPVARGPYHGWWGELKRVSGGRPTEEQTKWLEFLRGEGYRAEWHRGWEALWQDLTWYLSLPAAEVRPHGPPVAEGNAGEALCPMKERSAR